MFIPPVDKYNYIHIYSVMSDIDECVQGDPCNTVANSECKNTDGSYNCQCKDGFVMNGHNCEGTM